MQLVQQALTGKKLLGDELASDRHEHEEPADRQRDGGQHRWHEALDQALRIYTPAVVETSTQKAAQTRTNACGDTESARLSISFKNEPTTAVRHTYEVKKYYYP